MPTSPLHHLHASLGARFTDFGGWEMPVQYQGVIAEHLAVRRGVGIFDVSHLGRLTVTGDGATDLLRGELCNDVSLIGPGRAQYTMALTPEGGVVDDIIVLRLDEEDYWVLPNGANHAIVLDRLAAAAPDVVEISGRRDDTAFIAVQGPAARELVETVAGCSVGRFRVTVDEYDGNPLVVSGTGYTGEPGVEIVVPHETASDLFQALVDGGAAPCGLGARDTLRLEMGYPLWGQDLDTRTTPLEAGLEWVVEWDHDFVGKPALVIQLESGVAKSLVGFTTEGRAIPRHGYRLRSGDSVGEVTSGNFSPSLEHGIGMGYLAPPSDRGPLEVEIRGTWVEVERTDPPFLRPT